MDSEKEWKATDNRFIGFFDILGFKEMVMRQNHIETYKKLKEIKDFITDAIEGSYSGIKGKGGKIKTIYFEQKPKAVIFSDSILIISESDKPKVAESFIYHCNLFMKHCINAQIPIKGALSYGSFTADFKNSIFFGQPLIDAFLLHEELSMFGAILDFNIEKKLKELNLSSNFWNRLIKYKTPTKSGAINYYCINWLHVSQDKEIINYNPIIEKFYTTASGKPRAYVDNTADFIKVGQTNA